MAVKDARDCVQGYISKELILSMHESLPSNAFCSRYGIICVFFEAFRPSYCGPMDNLYVSFICYDPSVFNGCPEVFASATSTPYQQQT